MLEAHIVSPRGRLYYAGGTTADDLETLRQHLSDGVPDVFPGDIELEVVIDDPADQARVDTWLGSLARRGIQTRLFLAVPRPEWNVDEQAVANVG